MRLIIQFAIAIILFCGLLLSPGVESFSPTSCNMAKNHHPFHPAAFVPLKHKNHNVAFSSSTSGTQLYEKKKLKNDDDYMVLQDEGGEDAKRRNTIINIALGGVVTALGLAFWDFYRFTLYTPTGFQRISPTRFIAALGDPTASFGGEAKSWGVWRQDPGPRGVWLKDYQKELLDTNGIAPRGWRFNGNDFWIEEHGLIMESPTFPLPAGRYLVTGGRAVTTGLTVDGNGNWKLDEGASLYDVTHLPCRAARYNPITSDAGSPAAARLSDFPVKPGAIMPSIPGTNKQDYAVLFVIGKAV